jgi:hypothetical protein
MMIISLRVANVTVQNCLLFRVKSVLVAKIIAPSVEPMHGIPRVPGSSPGQTAHFSLPGTLVN